MTNTDGFMIVANGCVELYTEFEGNEFIIERVFVGGVLNSRSFLVEDLVYLNIRAVQNTKILKVHQKTIDELKEEYQDFESAINSVQFKALRSDKRYPIDVIFQLPKETPNKKEIYKKLMRENVFKNVVYQIILKKRKEMTQNRTLKNFLDKFRDKNRW